MEPVLSLVIHEVLPPEILGVIFEEHAILEWEAPTIDGQVCRFWREIVLNTPRVWAYLKIPRGYQPSMGELRLRLHRSSTAPLHIDIRAEGRVSCQRLYNLFSDHHTRIASLRMRYGDPAFFEGRDFPCMRLLDIANWYPARWGSMPELQSLRLGNEQLGVVPLSELAPLKTLSLCRVKCTSVLRHSQSLTALMIYNTCLVDAISGPISFPSLTYLSLCGIKGLKRHINAPSLVTYHEGGGTPSESFSIPISSLVEYGVYDPSVSSSDPAQWHLSFPNILRLAIRADEPVLLSFFNSLADQPHLLPALQTISPGGIYMGPRKIPKNVRNKIESLVLVRNEASNVNVALRFETVAPFQTPIFFGSVSDPSFK
jgi:hypothetical protein